MPYAELCLPPDIPINTLIPDAHYVSKHTGDYHASSVVRNGKMQS